ncbi:MAG TPA: NADH-quinone oxidoreductase subunit L [Candidatus Binataceae bacterium]|nr:NADH-quinone oxidoreductase subunit L [Candidatus Binataceae bacterium]
MTLQFPPLALILFFPALGFIFNVFYGDRAGRGAVNLVGPGVIFVAFAIALWSFMRLLAMPAGGVLEFVLWPWIVAGRFHTAIGLRLDALSAVMALVVTGVGALIHLYSVGYMEHDRDFARYFAYLNLFALSMLILVLADNLLLMFVGWEGVGLCSYLLIAFWYDNPQFAYNGRKAFVVNRVGDAGFVLGILTLVSALAAHGVWSLDFAAMQAHRAVLAPVATMAGLLLLLGATGKSAQIPLYVWLPDAMVGPTPVSALIHAATMVTAGVYMVARLNFLYTLTPEAMYVVATVGAVTAFFAATIAVVQTDIKRVLAYSTISQLGYMFMGVGVGAFAAGIFHVMTHAFFKALLFLCAGSIIHALDGEQDMMRMGALRIRMPLTYATMLAATLAISAVPGFSGYFSKDLILERTFEAGFPGLWLIGVITAALTAFYMFRLLFLTFHGSSRIAPDKHPHEPPATMTVPLVVLAVLAVIGGWVQLPRGWLWGGAFTRFLSSVVGPFRTEAAHGAATGTIGLIATLATLIGIVLAYVLYIQSPGLSERIAAGADALYRLLVRKYYVDEVYNFVFGRLLFWGSENVLRRGVDSGLIDGIVNGAGLGVEEAGDAARRSETGNVQVYAFVYLLGAVAIVAYYVFLVLVR